MSFTNQSGDLMPFAEVVPESAQFGSPEKSSILTQRRRCRVTPQTGSSSAPGQQVQFLISDQGGLIDMRSVVLNYTIVTAGTSAPCPDDGHPFMTFQALLNGQLLENIQNAPKVANIEMTMGGSKTYYQTAGSFQGFELLSDDLEDTIPTSSSINTSWAYVVGNQPDVATRSSRAANVVFGGIAGEQRSIPLGLMCGLGKCKQYIPIALTGELAFVLQTGQNGEVLFTTGSGTDGSYTLTQISMEYDIVVPDARYMAVLQKIAMEDGQGLVIPFESPLVTTGGVVPASATALNETSIIVSRATNNLLRAALVQVPQSAVALPNYPSQSCFSHASTLSVQFRIGSQVFPQVAAQGDAALFNMSLCAYGSAMQENGSVTNRCLWGNSTNIATPGTAAVYETAQVASGGSAKWAYADRFVPSYGFQVIKGSAEPLAVDGISLAGASGSQLIVTLVSAPAVAYTPYVVLTALKFIKAQAGAVSVVGA
jgi:hypothetical protein